MSKKQKYRAGDYVAVKAKVYSINNDNGNDTITCSFVAPGALHNNITFSVLKDDIIAHYPEPIKVGDKVKWNDGYTFSEYTVMCIDDKVGWLKHNTRGGYVSVTLVELERV